MLPHVQRNEKDYRKRFEVLRSDGVLKAPDVKATQSLGVLKPDVLDDLSFGFFVAWVLTGVLNDKVHISFVPLPHDDTTILVACRRPGHLAGPDSSLKVIELDQSYLRCPLDESIALPSKTQQVLCPVLNKLRYNLGADGNTERYAIPAKSESCCNSRKQQLWTYFRNTVLVAPDIYGRMFGGTAIPLRVPPSLFAAYATGLDPTRGDFGKIIDETLLWYAMEASGCLMGITNVEFTAPFLSHEIDFLLYDAAGKPKQKIEPSGGWASFVSGQSICIFETTVGHRREKHDTPADNPAELVGNDHPKNKLLNFLALSQAGFKKLRFFYLTITGFGKNLSQPTERALKGTQGFDYWSLGEAFPDADSQLMNHLDQPVPIAAFRHWHKALVDKVKAAARDWATS